MNELTISHLLSIRWILSKIANLISSHRSLLLPIMEQWDKFTLSNSNIWLLALMEGIRTTDNLRQCHLGLVLEYVLYSYSFTFDILSIHIHSNNDVTIFKTNIGIAEASHHIPVSEISFLFRKQETNPVGFWKKE